MSTLGAHIVGDSARTVREAVRKLASRWGWTVVAYEAFFGWAVDVIARSADKWVALDPLFPVGEYSNKVTAARLRRGSSVGQVEVTGGWDFLSGEGEQSLAIIDDAVASGATMSQACKLVSRAGRRVSYIAVCASNPEARRYVRQFAREAIWADYVRGDWRILHLRDGCPHLPYSGRRTSGLDAVHSKSGPVELRAPPWAVPGSLWQVLCLDREVQSVMVSARLEVSRVLGELLCRPATVADLALLGAGCPGLVMPATPAISGETTLDSLALSTSV